MVESPTQSFSWSGNTRHDKATIEEYDNVRDFNQRQKINGQGDSKFAFSSNFCQKARIPLKGLIGMSTQYYVDKHEYPTQTQAHHSKRQLF